MCPMRQSCWIIDADRFGLAQLQPVGWGRVGRGADASYCILVANPKNGNRNRADENHD